MREERLLDVRGLSLALPIVEEALAQLTSGTLITLLDGEGLRDDIINLAQDQGLPVSSQEEDRGFRVDIEKPDYKREYFPGMDPQLENFSRGWLLLVSHNGLGQGSKELGQTLLSSFFYHLAQATRPPRSIIFINGGVHCACQNSPLLEYLSCLEQQGVEIITCRISLELFGLQDSLSVGFSAPMPLLVERISQAVQVASI
ncbi:MAG: hypothetical protein FWF85_09445 [Clostridiales bacterium]|nr:hypothetical protein [Clostridiales bacterium]